MKKVIGRRNMRFAYPEFLPDPNPDYRNQLREKLERQDMLQRRQMVDLPEFYVGSIVGVTVADPNVGLGTPPKKDNPGFVPEKRTRFVGIVIDRGGCGLRSWCVVRNVIDGFGVEICYELYSPTIVQFEVLRLEKRLDNELFYLRDCPQEFSTFPIDMESEFLPEGESVPTNDTIVPIGPKPWHRKWEMYMDRLSGYSISGFDHFEQKKFDKYNSVMMRGWHVQVLKYDLMKEYYQTIPLEEQDSIWASVGPALEERDRQMKRAAAKRSISSK